MQTVATNMLIDLGGCLSKLDFGWQIRTLPGTALSWPERLSLGSAGRDKKKKKDISFTSMLDHFEKNSSKKSL